MSPRCRRGAAPARPSQAHLPVGLGRVSRIASRAVGSGAQPDEDVGHTDGGLVADGELVEAGGHRPELLAPVHQPLDLVAGAIALAVKGRRPPTPGTLAGPIGPAAVGLVPGQMPHPGARPAPASRAGHPHGIDQPDQLAGVGVLAGVRRLARLRPWPSQMVRTLVVSPPRERPSAWARLAWIDGSPLCGPRRRAGGPG
jgi:hypothetical protein